MDHAEPLCDDLSVSCGEFSSLPSGTLPASVATTGIGRASHSAKTEITPFRKRAPPIPSADKTGAKVWAAATRVGLKARCCGVGGCKGVST